MKRKEYKRNKPVTTLLRQYVNKKSGKVSEAKRELQRRFDCLDWSQQKKILEAHLMSSPSDRHWAYPKLLNWWDKSFEPMIKGLWEENHEERCSWLVVRFFPEEYIIENFDALADGRNYFFICLRLGKRSTFQIDKLRLSPLDYLYVMYSLMREVRSEDVLDCLWQIAYQECSRPNVFNIDKPRFQDRLDNPTPLNVRDLNRAFYYVSKMGLTEVVDCFTAWCDKVCEEIKEDIQQLQTVFLSDREYNEKAYHILLQSMFRNMPESYRNMGVKRLSEQHEPFKQLVDALNLEEVVSGDMPF